MTTRKLTALWSPRRWVRAIRGFALAEIEKAAVQRIKNSLAFCGANVTIRPPVVIEFAEGVRIGDGVYVNAFVHMWGNGGIRIGERTMIASHVAIASATHVPDAPIMSETLVLQPVHIENDVWIGSHAVIFPGVRIGAHAIIAAGSIVRSNVAPFTVVAGVPATVIRTKEVGA